MLDCRLLKDVLCLRFTVGLVGVMVMTPGWESVGCEFKYSAGIFRFLEERPSLISRILNTKMEKTRM